MSEKLYKTHCNVKSECPKMLYKLDMHRNLTKCTKQLSEARASAVKMPCEEISTESRDVRQRHAMRQKLIKSNKTHYSSEVLLRTSSR